MIRFRSNEKKKFMIIHKTKRAALLAAAALFGFLALAPSSRLTAGLVNIDWSTVGDPCNAADANGIGAVNYVYNIGTYDVTTGQYAAFLNAVAASDPYGLFDGDMINPFTGIGVARSGSPGSYTYAAAGNPNMPVVDVSWGDAARFANWLQNGQPNGAEGPGTTETGAYTLNGAVTTAALTAVTRNANATIFLPTEDEWYKAAYYKGGGTDAGYWLYPTQSDTAPINILSATGTNNANFYDQFNTGNGGYTDPANLLTPVGTFADSPGPYGTYDMGGDVSQWNETDFSGTSPGRGAFGGNWDTISNILASNYVAEGLGADPTYTDDSLGFRVASVPEPGSLCLLLIGVGGLLIFRRRPRCTAPRSLHRQHSLQCDERPAGGFVVHADDVHRRARRQVFQAPAKMRQVDSIHRGAHADDRRKKMNLLLRMLVL
jgi:formylglycine-generating enzyme